MPEIFDYPIQAEMPFLEELAEDLEGAFHVIAHAGYATKKHYIKKRQKKMREKYGRFLKYVTSDVGIFHIIPAYVLFQDLLDDDPTPEMIIDKCEEGLEAHLRGKELEDYDDFNEFYKGSEDTRERI